MGIKCQMLTTRYVAKVREQLLAPDYKSRKILKTLRKPGYPL
jgi:hypothetical protein